MKNYAFFILALFAGQIMHGEDSDKWQMIRDNNMLMSGEDVYTDTNLANYNPKDLIKTKINSSVDLALLKKTRDWRERLPAKDFPGGNWGPLTNDVQVSLRFEKPLYTNGEAFHVIVLIRNCGTNQFEYLEPYHFNHDQVYTSVNYYVVDQANRPVAQKKLKHITIQSPSIGGMTEMIEPNTQKKNFEDLNNIYDLTKGDYFVEASVIALHDPSKFDSSYSIASAKVPLEIR